jgi:hypothetical protein
MYRTMSKKIMRFIILNVKNTFILKSLSIFVIFQNLKSKNIVHYKSSHK